MHLSQYISLLQYVIVLIILFHYSSRVVDGTEVIVETPNKPRTAPSSGDDTPKKGPDQPPPGHKDIITDVIVMNEPQRLVITSARDGTIKMWK